MIKMIMVDAHDESFNLRVGEWYTFTSNHKIYRGELTSIAVDRSTGRQAEYMLTFKLHNKGKSTFRVDSSRVILQGFTLSDDEEGHTTAPGYAPGEPKPVGN